MTNGPLSSRYFNIYTGAPEANHEAQYYTNSLQNIAVKDGSLVITALSKPANGYLYTSARINSQGKIDVLYGKIVVNATLPGGIGTWPAIWMLSADKKYAQLSPSSDLQSYMNDGEIDIAESVGTQPHTVYGIAHSLAFPSDGEAGYFGTINIPDSDTVFHEYGVEWTPTRLTYTVDNKPYFTITKKPGADYISWPYDQHFYLLINLALGGTWGGVDRQQFPLDGVNPASLPATMKIKSISYYPYFGPR